MRPHVFRNSSEGSIGNHRDSRIPETWRELLRPRGAEEESTGLRPKRTAEELGSTAGEQEEDKRRAERHSRTT